MKSTKAITSDHLKEGPQIHLSRSHSVACHRFYNTQPFLRRKMINASLTSISILRLPYQSLTHLYFIMSVIFYLIYSIRRLIICKKLKTVCDLTHFFWIFSLLTYQAQLTYNNVQYTNILHNYPKKIEANFARALRKTCLYRL